MDSGRTPEEVCEDDPDLCEAVRDQWRRTRAVETQLEAMFPTPNARTGTRRAAHEALRAGAALPAIDGYAVEELIGLGGMGVVYRARHHKLNRVVAIDQFEPSQSLGGVTSPVAVADGVPAPPLHPINSPGCNRAPYTSQPVQTPKNRPHANDQTK